MYSILLLFHITPVDTYLLVESLCLLMPSRTKQLLMSFSRTSQRSWDERYNARCRCNFKQRPEYRIDPRDDNHVYSESSQYWISEKIIYFIRLKDGHNVGTYMLCTHQK